MIENINVNNHASISINSTDGMIYIDPYLIDKDLNDAKYIFITHNHYDHLSVEDIKKVIKDDTVIIVTEDGLSKLSEFENEKITVKPNTKYSLDNINFETIAAYNNEKVYHPVSNNWVGYVIEVDNKKYFIAGDTDMNKENKLVKCDCLFIPIDGEYTMGVDDAVTLTKLINPKIAIPTHYKTKVDAITYTQKLDNNISTYVFY